MVKAYISYGCDKWIADPDADNLYTQKQERCGA